jgi:hypothetical protein
VRTYIYKDGVITEEKEVAVTYVDGRQDSGKLEAMIEIVQQ